MQNLGRDGVLYSGEFELPQTSSHLRQRNHPVPSINEDLERARPQGAEMKENTKPKWLERYKLFLIAVFSAVCGIIVQLVTGYPSIEELDEHLAILGSVILLFVFFSALILWFLYFLFSEKNELSTGDKILLLSIIVLNGTAIMAANVVLLEIIYKSYIGLAAIPVIGFILVIGIFCLELKLEQNQGTPINSDDHEPMSQNQGTPIDSVDHESMVKNNLMIAIAITAVGCSVQEILITQGYLKNSKFPKNHPQFNLILPCLTSALGCFVMIITSAPLHFKSDDLMYGFLKQIPKFMAISVWLVAANLSAEFLDRILMVVAGLILVGVETMVMVCQRCSEQRATRDNSRSTDHVEVDPIHATVIAYVFGVLSLIYSQNFGGKGYGLFLTLSVLFLYLSITTILIRMVFPARPRSDNRIIKIIEIANYSLPVVLALVSLALLLAEMYIFIKRKISAGKVGALPGQRSPLPH